MGKKLIITEKPSVAMEFAKVVAPNGKRNNGYIESDSWIVTWCVGHLVTMSYPEVYDPKLKLWRLDTLPFIPNDDEWKYEIIKNVASQFEIVQRLLQREDADIIYNAGDSGREGEYIQRLVYMMAKPNPKAKILRVWIDSQTEEEIKRGIREAKEESYYNNLSDSAFLRAKEDYLIGINFSRLLTIIYGRNLAKSLNADKASISVGRVMTCVLGMVVSREREIRNFKKTSYYKINGKFAAKNKEDQKFIIDAEWRVSDTSEMKDSPKLYNENGFKKEADAKDFIGRKLTKSDENVANIVEIKKSKQKENPPLLFNLAELQNECTRLFKISPDETLENVQNLYEKKLCTYPRTDARVLSNAVNKVITKNLNGIAKGYKNAEIQGFIKQMAEKKYKTDLSKTKYVDDSKITDHYAIIPTGQGYENLDKLPEIQQKIYNVIVKRFLQIYFPPAEYEKINLTLDIDGENFYASTKICTNEGYLVVANSIKNDKDQKSNGNDNNVDLASLNLRKGQKLEIDNFEIKTSETTPPKRYNSGSMILAMENAGKLIEDEELREQIKGAGIGTSATRGGIIAKLVRINYIQINKKTQIITPTEMGEKIYDIINLSMPDMLNPNLTASWEKGLDMVAKGEIPANEFMTKLKSYINKKFEKLVVKNM